MKGVQLKSRQKDVEEQSDQPEPVRTWQPSTMPPFDETKVSWDHYRQRILNKFILSGIPEDKKVLAFLDSIGEETYAKVSDLCSPEFPENKTLEELMDILSKHFNPLPNKYAERVKFHSRLQNGLEGIKDYSIALKNLARHCQFPKHWIDEALCTQLIIGVKDERLRLNLFSLDAITFQKAVEVATNFETNLKANGSLRPREHEGRAIEETEVAAVKCKHELKRRTSKCSRCNRDDHNKSECPHVDAKCYKCGALGHLARACWAKDARNRTTCARDTRQVNETDNFSGRSGSKGEEDCFKLCHEIKPTLKTTRQILTVPVVLGDSIEDFQLDTGASVSLISKVRFREIFPKVRLGRADIKLRTYTKEYVKLIGMIKVKATVNKQTRWAKLYVVDGDYSSLFGLEWLWIFKLNWEEVLKKNTEPKNDFTNSVEGKSLGSKRLDELLTKYSKIFEKGVGKIKGAPVRLSVKEGTKPVYKRARPVAYALLPKVTAEIERLEREGIISKVNFSDYATPVVPIMKKDGSVRLCGDFKTTLNKLLNADDHPIPNIDYLLTKLRNNKYFSKLDITQAYNQLEVHPDDRHLVTINTHLGLYEYNRVPFGITNAPAIWQRRIEEILRGIEGVSVFYDDIGIATKSLDEHFEILQQVFDRLIKFNIKINACKCALVKESIDYCGFRLSSEGIHTIPEKVEAISKVPEPRSVTEVRAFLGLVTFYGKFIPNLSILAKPLHELLKKGTKFVFCSKCRDAFKNIKEELTSDRVLVHYDPQKELLLATDASSFGLGAVISHKMEDGSERPVAFASRTLTATECKYSQIDKEALGIIYGVKRFYNYLIGRHFTLITDHKPLVSIFHPEKELPRLSAMRMQHYAIYLQAFNYEIRYRKTNEHGNADALSRLPRLCNVEDRPTGCDIFQLEQIGTLPVTSKVIAEETDKDPEARDLLEYLRAGHRTAETFLGHRATDYSLQDGCILWGQRVYVPKKLRKLVLDDLHEGHQGIVKTKQLSRSFIWWPKIDEDITRLISSCLSCQQFRNNPPKESQHCWEYPNKPMDRIHVDYAGPFRGRYYLIIVDAHSKWVEVYPVTSTTSRVTKECLMKFFSAYGLPLVLVSDNGPQFISEEFKEFCNGCGINQKFTAPFHPSTNGQAEKSVQTIKNALNIALVNENNVHRALTAFLFAYRRTPHSTTGVPPSQLFLGRSLRSRLDLLKPSVEQKTPYNKKECQPNKMTGTHRRPRFFEEGDQVFVRFYGNSYRRWKVGQIKKRFGKLHYEVEVDGGRHRRHIDQLRKVTAQEQGTVDTAKMSLVHHSVTT